MSTCSKYHVNLELWYEDFRKARRITNNNDGTSQVQKQWKPADHGSVKMNVDGSFIAGASKGGVGGILRNDTGTFMAAFAVPVHALASAMQIELLAMQEGIKILKRQQYSKAVLETDCLQAILAIRQPQFTYLGVDAILQHIRMELASCPWIEMQFTPRECNQLAHRLPVIDYESQSEPL